MESPQPEEAQFSRRRSSPSMGTGEDPEWQGPERALKVKKLQRSKPGRDRGHA